MNEALFEPVIRLGVTGLSRAGKTVFITSLVANLLDRGRMHQLSAAASGRIETAFLQPQPDDTVPRFEFEKHLADMIGPDPQWPESTRTISQMRLSLKVQPSGVLGGMRGLRTIHLDIVDYPGEWLLDLPLLHQSFSQWSDQAIGLARSRASQADGWLVQLEGCDPSLPLDEVAAQALSGGFTSYLRAARNAGFSACAPGRFLMPGDLTGSPALTFAPLPAGKSPRGSLYRAFERRFESYKSKVIKPFFRDHFSRIDRQIVLVDVLGAIHGGPRTVEDLRGAMADVLTCFRPGKNSWLSTILGKRVEKILFAATKADHLHHRQHPQLTAIMDALIREARDRARFSGATTAGMSIASLRSTVEHVLDHNGTRLDCVQGILSSSGKKAAMYPGALPEDPTQILHPAQQGAEKWLDQDYAIMGFAPAKLTLSPGDGPPHIRLDKAAEFLLGDRLK